MQTQVRERYLALLSEAFAERTTWRGDERPQVTEREPIGGRLDAEDSARMLAGFHRLPQSATPSLRFVRSSGDGQASAYAWDEDSGMVYILD